MGRINIRVDDRLIHGQTVLSWCPKYKIQEIIAIDDVSASNPMLKSILTMGVPGNYKTNIVTTSEAKELLQQNVDHNRFVIVKYPHVLKELEDFITPNIPINLGNIAKQEDSIHSISGATGIFYLSEEDVRFLQTLVDRGVSVNFQQLPSTTEISWDAFLKTI